jgi:hypothetical protein
MEGENQQILWIQKEVIHLHFFRPEFTTEYKLPSSFTLRTNTNTQCFSALSILFKHISKIIAKSRDQNEAQTN